MAGSSIRRASWTIWRGCRITLLKNKPRPTKNKWRPIPPYRTSTKRQNLKRNPVSYTHLVVYKRQFRGRSPFSSATVESWTKRATTWFGTSRIFVRRQPYRSVLDNTASASKRFAPSSRPRCSHSNKHISPSGIHSSRPPSPMALHVMSWSLGAKKRSWVAPCYRKHPIVRGRSGNNAWVPV